MKKNIRTENFTMQAGYLLVLRQSRSLLQHFIMDNKIILQPKLYVGLKELELTENCKRKQLMELVLISPNLADRFKCVWIKTVIRSSLVCVRLNKRLHIGDSYEPQSVLFVIKPASVVTATDNAFSRIRTNLFCVYWRM